MQTKIPKQPTKTDQKRMLVEHNLPQLLRSIDKLRKAANKLDCALAECRLYANILAPHITRSKGGSK